MNAMKSAEESALWAMARCTDAMLQSMKVAVSLSRTKHSDCGPKGKFWGTWVRLNVYSLDG